MNFVHDSDLCGYVEERFLYLLSLYLLTHSYFHL
jgi:hypothetical protein